MKVLRPCFCSVVLRRGARIFNAIFWILYSLALILTSTTGTSIITDKHVLAMSTPFTENNFQIPKTIKSATLTPSSFSPRLPSSFSPRPPLSSSPNLPSTFSSRPLSSFSPSPPSSFSPSPPSFFSSVPPSCFSPRPLSCSHAPDVRRRKTFTNVQILWKIAERILSFFSIILFTYIMLTDLFSFLSFAASNYCSRRSNSIATATRGNRTSSSTSSTSSCSRKSGFDILRYVDVLYNNYILRDFVFVAAT